MSHIPLLIMFSRNWSGYYLVGISGISFSINFIKLVRSWELGAYTLYSSLLIECLQVQLTIMDRSSSVLELLHVLIPWENPIFIIFGPIKYIHLVIYVYSWPRNYRPMIFLVYSKTQRTMYFNPCPFNHIWPFYNHHGRYFSLWILVAYCFSLWIQTFYLCRLLFLLLREDTAIWLTPSSWSRCPWYWDFPSVMFNSFK